MWFFVSSLHHSTRSLALGREGAHNILQIRASRASNKWNEDWDGVKQRFYIPKDKAA